jgi:hypothetical protein
VNWNFPPVITLVELGDTAIELTVGAAVVVETVTLDLPDFDGSATLVAVTVSVPALAGAVYAPAALMVPSIAFQVTVFIDVVPCTVAVNGNVPPGIEDAAAGVTVTEVTSDPDAPGVAALAIDTVAVADFVGSATLVAMIFPVPPAAGAVKTPAVLIVPIEAAHVTDSFVVAP